jgi:hypothetical protein
MKIKKVLAALVCFVGAMCPLSLVGAESGADRSSLTEEEITRRLRFVEERLDAGRRHASYWQQGWISFYSISALAQGVFAVSEDNKDDRVNNLVGAVKSTGGALDMFLRPLPGRHGADEIRAAEGNRRERMLHKLLQAENLLQRSAQRAEERTSWKRHLTVLGVNLAAGAVIWGFGDQDDAVVSTAVGIAVGEANIWSQPWRAQSDLQDYQKLFSEIPSKIEVRWDVLPIPGGAVLRVSF